MRLSVFDVHIKLIRLYLLFTYFDYNGHIVSYRYYSFFAVCYIGIYYTREMQYHSFET